MNHAILQAVKNDDAPRRLVLGELVQGRAVVVGRYEQMRKRRASITCKALFAGTRG